MKPAPFLTVLVEDATLIPPLTALCAGYEQEKWRAHQFGNHLFEWLPEFALSWKERQDFSDATAVALLRRAAQVVYTTEKYGRRGEFGELILHAMVRQLFDSEPAISKLFLKDSSNDTVKGFDAVHVVPAQDGSLELWLGESKFYEDVASAIAAVAAELESHTDPDYLRAEFAAVTNKIDDDWPFASRLKLLLHPNTSLDAVFDVLRIPVLLTYDSKAVADHKEWTDEYREALDAEARDIQLRLANKNLPDRIVIQLLLMPIASKKALTEIMNAQLQAWQLI